MGDEMRKGIVPAADARGYCDDATAAALLKNPLPMLRKPGEEVCLRKPLTFVAMKIREADKVAFDFTFPAGSFVARLRVKEWEEKAGWGAYLLSTPDRTLQVYFKEHRGQVHFMKSTDVNAEKVYPRPTAALGMILQVDAAFKTPIQWDSWK